MARQDEDRFAGLIRAGYVLAFDPGSKWTGVAAVHITARNRVHMETALLDTSARTWLDLMEMFSWLNVSAVVCEQFQIRPQGYNAFDSGQTLRCIGAIELQTQQWDKPLFYVKPGSPNDLRQMPLHPLIEQWQFSWPKSKHWQHAKSAWRALSFALAHSKSVTQSFSNTSGIALRTSSERLVIDAMRAIPDDSIAPVAHGDL